MPTNTKPTFDFFTFESLLDELLGKKPANDDVIQVRVVVDFQPLIVWSPLIAEPFAPFSAFEEDEKEDATIASILRDQAARKAGDATKK
ncbi:MAG: hypothetical protein GY822_22480 [Deltaproteobacteria bacterium]|nr:hypothetical protein [Deltaproteobacteria bacterium]